MENMKFVGVFNEDDLAKGIDRVEVKKAKEKYGLNYTETKLVKKGKKIVGIKIWVCDADTFTL